MLEKDSGSTRASPALLGLCVAALVAGSGGPARANPDLYDSQEQARIAREMPAAADLLHRAQGAMGAGQPATAEALLARARALVPRSALPARRHCEALAALGRKQEAIAACDRARMLGGSPADMRATVAAYLAGAAAPTVEDVGQAMHYAELAREREPDLHFGAAGRCDLARKLGDGHMLRACLAELQRVAPDHEETRRALAAAAAGPPWRLLVGLGVLALAGLATLAHALWRALKLRQRVAPRPADAPVALLALAALFLAGARAQAAPAAGGAAAPAAGGRIERSQLSDFEIDDADPERTVPTPEKIAADPLQFGYLLQDLIDRADAATRSGDHAAAIRYYRAVVKAVPDRSVGLAKLCAAYEANGERDNAIKACGVALTKPGVKLEDHVRFVRLMLGTGGVLGGPQRNIVQSAIGHLRRQPGGLLPAEQLQCELALELGDTPMLQTCSAALAVAAPADARTVFFQWALAVRTGDSDGAGRLVARAREIGMAPDSLRQMEAVAVRSHPLRRWGLPVLLLMMAAVAVVAAGLLARGALRRRAAAPIA
jgi:tetratricopeptide (TPR) repeat protein